MGCLRSLLIAGALLINLAASGWMLLVLLGTGRVFGNAVMVAETDAIVGVVLLAAAFVGNLVLALLLWWSRVSWHRRERAWERRLQSATAQRPPEIPPMR